MLHATFPRAAWLSGIALVVLSTLTSRVEAQNLPRVQVGERIRVIYSEESSATNSMRVSGTLIERRADTLVVALSPEAAPTTVPVASIWQLDAHRPRPERILWYSLIGAGAGAVTTGGLFWLADGLAPCFGYCPPATSREVIEAAAFGAVLVGVPTALVASYIVLAHPWQRMRLPHIASVNTAPDGRIALSAALPF